MVVGHLQFVHLQVGLGFITYWDFQVTREKKVVIDVYFRMVP